MTTDVRLETVAKSSSSQVCFLCQRCSQPLKLEPSFYSVDPNVYAELTAPLTSTTSADDVIDFTCTDISLPSTFLGVDDTDVTVRHIPAPPLLKYTSSDSGNGFTLLGDVEPPVNESLSHRMRVAAELYDILSGQSEVDHPLCEECTDTLLDQLDQQLKTTEDECKDYRDFLERLSSTKVTVDEASLDEELRQLEAEEEVLKSQLEEVELQKGRLEESIARETEKGKKLDEEQERYYKERNEFKRQLLEYEDAQKSVDNQLRYARTQLERLKKTNVFNTTFHIWHNGHFGTINNFRLGRLPNIPVEWTEINTAWGQTVLLLHSLANKMNLTFERYRLVPFGNYSYLECLSDKSKELPLYSSGGIKFFWDTKFDQAMVAFLDCLQQFKEQVEKGDDGFCLPYKMDKGRIEDPSTGTAYSVKIQFNSEEQWTKALKFMLTNLKWGLAWVSSQFANK
jgi:beclin 1